MMQRDKSLAECSFRDGAFVLPVGGGLVLDEVEHACLLAQSRAYSSCELWKWVCAVEQAVGQLPVPFVERVVPFRGFVAQRACPVAERHTAVHASAGLQLALACVERLLHLAEVVYAVVHRTVACLLTMDF